MSQISESVYSESPLPFILVVWGRNHCLLYNVYTALNCTLYSVHCILYNIQCTLYSENYPVQRSMDNCCEGGDVSNWASGGGRGAGRGVLLTALLPALLPSSLPGHTFGLKWWRQSEISEQAVSSEQ